jgi:hypothetical protein
MMKLVGICASANDLFGLDGDGVVYQYNFNTKTWMALDRGRSDRRESSLDEGPSAPAEPRLRTEAQPERERML